MSLQSGWDTLDFWLQENCLSSGKKLIYHLYFLEICGHVLASLVILGSLESWTSETLFLQRIDCKLCGNCRDLYFIFFQIRKRKCSIVLLRTLQHRPQSSSASLNGPFSCKLYLEEWRVHVIAKADETTILLHFIICRHLSFIVHFWILPYKVIYLPGKQRLVLIWPSKRTLGEWHVLPKYDCWWSNTSIAFCREVTVCWSRTDDWIDG